jgi:hypothetical protein
MPTATTPRRRAVLDLRRAVPRPIRRDCQKCGGTVTGHSAGADFVCNRAGHVTEPLSTGPIRTYA